MNNYDKFVNAIHEKRILVIKYYSQKDKTFVVRKCAPFDFWPKRKWEKKYWCDVYIDNSEKKYLFWDLDGSGWWHIVWKSINEVSNIDLTDENFVPEDFIDIDSVKCPWFIDRQW